MRSAFARTDRCGDTVGVAVAPTDAGRIDGPELGSAVRRNCLPGMGSIEPGTQLYLSFC
jgi:hypothetical protein